MAYTKQVWIDNDISKPASAARFSVMEQGIYDAHDLAEGGKELDVAIRKTNFDVAAVGTTWTNVEGQTVSVDAYSKPWAITWRAQLQLDAGTAAHTASIAPVGYIQVQIIEVATTNVWYSDEVEIQQNQSSSRAARPKASFFARMPPTLVKRYYRLQARLRVALPSGWAQALILGGAWPGTAVAGDPPSPPMILQAVSLGG